LITTRVTEFSVPQLLSALCSFHIDRVSSVVLYFRYLSYFLFLALLSCLILRPCVLQLCFFIRAFLLPTCCRSLRAINRSLPFLNSSFIAEAVTRLPFLSEAIYIHPREGSLPPIEKR